MRKALLPLLLCLPSLLRADVCPSVAGRLLMDSPTSLALGAKGALASWKAWFSVTDLAERDDGTRDFAMTAVGAPKIAGTFRAFGGAGAESPSAVEAEWAFTPEGDVALGMLGVAGDLGMAAYGGGVLAHLHINGIRRTFREGRIPPPRRHDRLRTRPRRP